MRTYMCMCTHACVNILKKYNIKDIDCPLLISINIDVILDQETKNKKEKKMIRLEPRL